MSITVSVTSVVPNGSIAIAFGTNVETGKKVSFGGDWRPLRDVAEAIDNGEYVEVEVEEWQLLHFISVTG